MAGGVLEGRPVRVAMTAEAHGTSTAGWPWPDSLDALSAAPQHHTLVFENEHVRVLKTRILPGDRVPLHTHRWPSVVHVLSWSDFVRRDEAGEVVADSRAVSGGSPPTIVWSPALPAHSLENVGSAEMLILSVELKRVAA
jgi:hypothetical protein